MPLQLLLAEDELAVERHLKHAAARRNERPCLDIVLEFRQDTGRQTDGSLGIASLGAVLHSDMQLIHLFSW